MIGGIHISSSEMTVQKEGLGKKNIAALTKDQRITAKVVKLLPQGKALLQIGGQTVSVKTNILLAQGEDVQLTVQEKNNNIILKLIAPVRNISPQKISSLVRFFSKSDFFSDLPKIDSPEVKTILDGIALKSGKSDPHFLPKLIDKMGLLFEKKLEQGMQVSMSERDLKNKLKVLLTQDLKGRVLNELASGDGKISANKIMTSFVETMENFQQLNHQSSETGRYLLPFPVAGDSVFRFGQLLIDTGGKKQSDKKPTDKMIQVSFLLDMSRLGPLRADFSILKNAITGRFLLVDEQTASYVESMIPDLRHRLSEIDYELKSIECKTAKTEDLEQHCLIESLVKSNENSVLNIMV